MVRKGAVSWITKVKKRRNELEGMDNTHSYIPVKKFTKRGKSYQIHDNGGRPFKVVVNKDGLFVYVWNGNEGGEDGGPEETIYGDVIFELSPDEFEGYWSGFDSSPYEFHGNSILVKINANRYISIGWTIYQFDTDEEIIDYVSPVGNSDVPYPVAYGTEYVYFMLDMQKVLRSELEVEATVGNAEEIYGEFYGHLHKKKYKIPKLPIDNVEIIQDRFMDYDI